MKQNLLDNLIDDLYALHNAAKYKSIDSIDFFKEILAVADYALDAMTPFDEIRDDYCPTQPM